MAEAVYCKLTSLHNPDRHTQILSREPHGRCQVSPEGQKRLVSPTRNIVEVCQRRKRSRKALRRRL
jgi:hypothetical protein